MPSRRPSTRAAALVPLLAWSLAACVVPGGAVQPGTLDPRGARTPGEGDVPDTGGGRVKSLPVSRKVVTGKEPPTTLFAADGTRCTVTTKRYEETREGERVLCAWRKG